MNGKDLIESMTHVDEKYIAEAEEAPRRRRHWQGALVSAACLALVLVGAWQLWPEQLDKGQAALTNDTAMAAQSAGTAAPLMETAAQDEAFPAAARFKMAPAPVQMTVRVVEQAEGRLSCVVIDPGTSDFQPEDRVEIALPESGPVGAMGAAAAPTAERAESASTAADSGEEEAASSDFSNILDAGADSPVYQVCFLPDQDDGIITPTQWTLLEDQE